PIYSNSQQSGLSEGQVQGAAVSTAEDGSQTSKYSTLKGTWPATPSTPRSWENSRLSEPTWRRSPRTWTAQRSRRPASRTWRCAWQLSAGSSPRPSSPRSGSPTLPSGWADWSRSTARGPSPGSSWAREGSPAGPRSRRSRSSHSRPPASEGLLHAASDGWMTYVGGSTAQFAHNLREGETQNAPRNTQ